MKSVMTAGMEFGKQLTEQNPEMAEVMGFDGSQVKFLEPYCTGEKYLTLYVPYHTGEKSLTLSHTGEKSLTLHVPYHNGEKSLTLSHTGEKSLSLHVPYL